MSFLLQRRSKAVVPTPDPPVRRQVPDRGIIEASVLVVPPDGLVRTTGMKYEEFNVESLSEMFLMYDKIIGLVQVAECNSSAIIIADVVSVPMKHVGEQVKPDTWYLPSRHTWQYPIVRRDHAQLLTRSKVEVQHHSTMDHSNNDYRGFNYQLLEGHRVFLVIHRLVDPYSQDTRIALNISASIGYYKR